MRIAVDVNHRDEIKKTIKERFAEFNHQNPPFLGRRYQLELRELVRQRRLAGIDVKELRRLSRMSKTSAKFAIGNEQAFSKSKSPANTNYLVPPPMRLEVVSEMSASPQILLKTGSRARTTFRLGQIWPLCRWVRYGRLAGLPPLQSGAVRRRAGRSYHAAIAAAHQARRDARNVRITTEP